MTFNDAALAFIDALKNTADLKPYPLALVREDALRAALTALAAELGCTLKPIGAINAHGEFLICAMDPQAPNAAHCGHFNGFAAVLNRAPLRCGNIEYGYNAIMIPENGWCYINHTQAERIVLEYFGEHGTVTA